MNGTSLRQLAVTLSTVAVAVSIAIDDGHAAKFRKGTVQAELPPGELTEHAVGDKAVWKYRKFGETSVVVTGVKRGVVSRRRAADGCSWDYFKGIWMAPVTRWKNCYGSSGTAKVSREGKLFPLEVGNSAKFSVQGKSKRPGKKVSKWKTTRHCKVRGTVNVTVPAGRFDTYRVDCLDDWSSYRYYYSPELQYLVHFSQKPRKGKSGRKTYVDLVRLERAGAPGDAAQTRGKTSSKTASSRKRITTEQAFRDLVVGRKMSNEHGFSMLHEDGSLSGEFGEGRLSGTWSWEGKFLCRIARHGNKNLGLDCQAVAVSGDKVTFTRKKGKGKKATYRLHAPEG